MDHHVVAQQAHLGAAPDDAFGDHAAGDLADPGDVEDFADRGVAEEALAQGRRQHARQRVAHVVDHIVDDRVVADLDAVALGQVARLRVGPHIEADDEGAGCLGQDHIAFVDPADRRVQHPHRDLVGRQLFERADNRLERALHVGFDDDRQLFGDP